LVSIKEENREARFKGILHDLGRHFKADEAYLITYSKSADSITALFHWTAGGEGTNLSAPGDLAHYKSKWFLRQILKDRLIIVNNRSEIPPDGEWIWDNLHPSVQSLAAIPIFSKGRILGVLGLNSYRPSAFSSPEELERMLRIPFHLVSDALVKIESEKKINYLAYYDPLTDLPNRALFFDRMEQAGALAERTGKKVAVMLMDLDSFKNINDSLGHDAGDLLLRQVSERLSHRIREYDTMSRFGGDEFLFLLSQINSRDEVASIAGKLIQALSEPIFIAGEPFHITGSAGISLFPDDGTGTEILINSADMAMYESKGKGKNCFTFYDAGMKEGAHEKICLTNELYRALEREEFLLYYQPQVALEGTRIVGMEALIRWNHPERGLILPSLFIPLAEDCGLINPMGHWVLETACSHNKSLQDRGFPPVKVAVNLSVKQFAGGVLAEEVKEVLRKTGLEPQYLELEITEGIAMGDSHMIMSTLQELRQMGITVSIDDFGTEYSSLNRLKEMPVDRIKIDKNFIQGITLNKNDESITAFIVDLSKSLNLKVVAEGVESDAQISFLLEKSCDEIQGYYFYEPMSLGEIEKILGNREWRESRLLKPLS
ncbi:MAG: sensor domain-containing phosphodiesterase, partial [Spirochaetales bacterium]|nr:sensor domain-containing phosphodiesterase [Spirochaetales bacterium]